MATSSSHWRLFGYAVSSFNFFTFFQLRAPLSAPSVGNAFSPPEPALDKGQRLLKIAELRNGSTERIWKIEAPGFGRNDMIHELRCSDPQRKAMSATHWSHFVHLLSIWKFIRTSLFHNGQSIITETDRNCLKVIWAQSSSVLQHTWHLHTAPDWGP